MTVTVYVNHNEGTVLNEKEMKELARKNASEAVADPEERDEYLNEYLEENGYNSADCFLMNEETRATLLADFYEWLCESFVEWYLDNHFEEYEIEV